MPDSTQIPTSTYRLQVNRHFQFKDVAALAPYLHQLGVGAVYLSPFFRARPDSTHGYDICDHNQLNPALGGEKAFRSMCQELQKNHLLHVCDFVPNHMGIGEPLNSWWMDVLENGPSSAYAEYFDIDWDPVKEELKDKVLLPILGDQYGRILERGELKLEVEGGSFFLRYYDHKLPLNPRTYKYILEEALHELEAYHSEELYLELQSIMTAMDYLPPRSEREEVRVLERAREKEVIKKRLERLCSECPQVLEAIQQAIHRLEGEPGSPRSFDKLHQLLDAQAFRLSYWRVAAEEINYRRFFDINDLAAIRMEKPKVFEATHRLLLSLIAEKAIHAVRIDHPDGLWNPKEYFQRLQAEAGKVLYRKVSAESKPLYVLVEKILSEGEQLREDWPVHGTTGYEFNNLMNGVLTDGSAEHVMTETYHGFLDERLRFNELAYRCKILVMRLSLANDVNVLGHMLNRLSEKHRRFRDFTLNALTAAVREVIASFPVYRTYLVPGEEVQSEDQQIIARAVQLAKRRNPGIERSIFDFIRELLLFQFPEDFDEEARKEHVDFVMKFQQCTGPITAKGLEDTAFYIYNRLVALNEVGGEPHRFGIAPEEFHHQNEARQRLWPAAMLNTSTHDTKRSGDVRARIVALSEIPQLWRRSVQRWSTANWKIRGDVEGDVAPDANEEYLFYQTVLGTWPLHRPNKKGWEEYVSRLQDYMTKAIKEAKVNSSWIQPNEEWDAAVRHFVSKSLARHSNNRFLKLLRPVAQQVAWIGACNSLTQLVCKLTVPGVPDIYQGEELWDFSLVDPDNRRAVDFEKRRELLAAMEGADPTEMLREWRDGRIKLWVTQVLLRLRQREPELFLQGDYRPLTGEGTQANNVLAFQRKTHNHRLLVVVPRLISQLEDFPASSCWEDTRLELQGLSAGPWKEQLTSRVIQASEDQILLKELLGDFPYGVFLQDQSEGDQVSR